MILEELGLIGNCQLSALVHRTGELVWCCLPRFDSEPIFAKLLDEKDGGSFLVGPADGEPGQQSYLENTNILETRFDTPTGSDPEKRKLSTSNSTHGGENYRSKIKRIG